VQPIYPTLFGLGETSIVDVGVADEDMVLKFNCERHNASRERKCPNGTRFRQKPAKPWAVSLKMLSDGLFHRWTTYGFENMCC